MKNSLTLFLIAGEASGDQLGASLMASLKAQDPNITFVGIGGSAMQAQGLRSIFPMEELSHMGLFSILKNLPHLRKRLKQTLLTIQEIKPDAVITIDAPEFSFRVMKALYKNPQRPQLIHYVAPTVWAWRPNRAKKIAKFLDHLLCLYPFEPPYFEKEGLKTTFVGHPITQREIKTKKPRDPNLLCLLPGSRRSEVETLLPIFEQTVTLLKKDNPDLKVIIPTVPAQFDRVKRTTEKWNEAVKVVCGDTARDDVFQKATVALAASGTVALELAAAKLPYVITYKIGPFSAWIAKRLLKTPWACMINILLAFKKEGPSFALTPEAKKRIPQPWIPELIQKKCTPENLAAAIQILLNSHSEQEVQVKAMDEALELLKAPPDIAAKCIREEIKTHSNH